MKEVSDKSGEIIKLREQGLTYQAIGKKLGISKVAVYKHLKKKGLTGKVNLISQVKDLQERVGKLEKEVEIWKAFKGDIISRLPLRMIK